jgi:hypothetical protein
MIVAGVLAASALTMSACGGGAGNQAAGGGHDACLLGTWTVDMQNLAGQFPKVLPYPGGTGQGTGTVSVTFGDQMTVDYADHFDVTVSIGGFPSVMSVSYKGSSASTQWQTTDGKLTGAMDTGKAVTIDTVLKNAYTSKAVDAPSGGDLKLSGEAYNYTCSGGSATISGQKQGSIVWKLSKA